MSEKRELASSEALAEIMAITAVAADIEACSPTTLRKARARRRDQNIDMFIGRIDNKPGWEYRIVSSVDRVTADHLYPQPLPKLVWLLEQRTYDDYEPLKRQVDEDMRRYEPKIPEDMTDGQDVVNAALSGMKSVLDRPDRVVRVHAYSLELRAASVACEEGVRFGSEKDEEDKALESCMLTGTAVDFGPGRAEMWAKRLAEFIVQDSGILKP